MTPRSTWLARSTAALLAGLALIASLLLFTENAHADEQNALSLVISDVCEEIATSIKEDAFTDEARAAEFYFAQDASGRCTITSVAMMLRRAAFLDDASDWETVTLGSTMADGWTSAGVKNNFSSAGYDVALIDVNGSTESLTALLEEHPEGIAIYDRTLPHAVLLTDYDAESGIFYCADPANYYAGKRIPLAESWNGECHGKSQDAAVASISGAWIIS